MVKPLAKLGRYHLIDRIAFGGMAEIFRAVTFDDDRYRRDVALKKLLPHFSEDRQFVTMLGDEFRIVSQLRHANIASVYEIAEAKGSLVVVMEYVDGKDLRSTTERAHARGVALRIDHICYIMARALDGLYHAHTACGQDGQALHIVHRDFTPSNILLSYDGRVKICDFGIAKAAHNQVQTKTGIIKGKIKYMSPEQASGKDLDHRSDIFAAGSVLYELCTGKQPFVADNEIDLLFLVREAEPTPCQELNPSIPDALARAIERAMQAEADARFANAAEFRDALSALLAEINAGYTRSKLSHFMRELWQQDIERELRILEELLIDPDSSATDAQASPDLPPSSDEVILAGFRKSGLDPLDAVNEHQADRSDDNLAGDKTRISGPPEGIRPLTEIKTAKDQPPTDPTQAEFPSPPERGS